jgi:hypothetical protein
MKDRALKLLFVALSLTVAGTFCSRVVEYVIWWITVSRPLGGI